MASSTTHAGFGLISISAHALEHFGQAIEATPSYLVMASAESREI